MADQTTTYNVPDAYKPLLDLYAGQGFNFVNQIFGGKRPLPQFDPSFAVPGFNWAQEATVNPALAIMQRSSEGMQTADVGNLFARRTMNGDFYNRPAAANPYEGLYVDPQRNAYAGENPYLQSMIGKAQGDLVDQYRRGTAANLDAQMAMANAFGGSGHREAMAANERNLGDALNNISNQFRFQDYTTQQGLDENAINRAAAMQQADLARNSALAQQQIGQTEQSFQNERNRGMQAAGLTPAMAGVDIASLAPLTQVGNAAYGIQSAQNQFSMNQDLRNAYPELFGFDVARGILGTPGGGTTTSNIGGGTNPWAQALGAAGLIGQIGGPSGFGWWGG